MKNSAGIEGKLIGQATQTPRGGPTDACPCRTAECRGTPWSLDTSRKRKQERRPPRPFPSGGLLLGMGADPTGSIGGQPNIEPVAVGRPS